MGRTPLVAPREEKEGGHVLVLSHNTPPCFSTLQLRNGDGVTSIYARSDLSPHGAQATCSVIRVGCDCHALGAPAPKGLFPTPCHSFILILIGGMVSKAGNLLSSTVSFTCSCFLHLSGRYLNSHWLFHRNFPLQASLSLAL